MVIKYKSNKLRRKAKTKHQVRGTSNRPRISVFRSNKYIYAQVIDDENKKTLDSSSSLSVKSSDKKKTTKIEQSMLVGETLGKSMKQKNLMDKHHLCFCDGTINDF